MWPFPIDRNPTPLCQECSQPITQGRFCRPHAHALLARSLCRWCGANPRKLTGTKLLDYCQDCLALFGKRNARH